MKTFALAAAAAVTLSTAAFADTVVTKQTESGAYSAPVAGATPQARENPSPGTTMMETREKTTVRETPSTTVVVPAEREVVTVPQTRVIETR